MLIERRSSEIFRFQVTDIRNDSVKILFQKYGLYIFLIFLIIFGGLFCQGFLKLQNIKNVLDQVAALGMVSIGQTFVILSGGGGLDLSVASVMSTVAVITSRNTGGNDMLLFPVAIICCLFGSLVGMTNGLLITKRKVPPVMATLGMMIIVQGLRFLYTGGAPTGDFPPFLRVLGTGGFGPIPVSFFSLLIMGAIAVVILNLTTFGRELYATGGNIHTAHLSGHNTHKIITIAYMISGLLAAIGGLYLAGWLGQLDNWVGKGYEIDSVAAVVMGGTSFEGGRGGVLGTLAAVLIIGIIFNQIILLGLPEHLQHVVKGGVIILAAALYVQRRRR